MKFLKLAVAAVLAFAGSSAYAFHDGGVAACEGCHVMHNATNGVAQSVATGVRSNTVNSYLLQGSDQSSTCLVCHNGVGTTAATRQFVASQGTATTAPGNYTPGGDFGWIGTGSNRRGHNVVAADFPSLSLQAEPAAMLTAPGGSFTSGGGKAAFACSNCHDPHGRYRLQGDPTAPDVKSPLTGGTLPITGSGSNGVTGTATISNAVGVYRILGGAGYSPASNPSFPFPNDPPFAVAPVNYNHDEAAGEYRVAYGQGMSEWCQNCHTNIHLDGYVLGAPGLRHPAGNGAKLQPTQANVYNNYVSSGVAVSGGARYTSLVPFESSSKNISDGSTDPLNVPAVNRENVNPTTNSTGVFVATQNKSNVMCLSCHRAHGSAFDSITRWDNNKNHTFITDGSGYVVDSAAGSLTSGQVQAGYYNRPPLVGNTAIGQFQRSLCNKCHGKD
jgi:hypothetical protein